jgi:adenosine deaminase
VVASAALLVPAAPASARLAVIATGTNDAALLDVTRNAVRASFASPERRAALLAEIDAGR